MLARILAFAMVLAAGLPLAQAASVADLSPEQAAAVDKVSQYFNSFKTLQGNFTQVSPKGTVSNGTMYISKPGKMRFDYAAPNPFLLVSDGKWVTLKDRSRERGDQIPLSTTPLRLVVSSDINLRRDAKILNVEQQEGMTSVLLEDTKGLVSGQLLLVYDETRNQLQQWIIVDSKGRRTTVTLSDLEPGVTVDPKLFMVKIERKKHGDQ